MDEKEEKQMTHNEALQYAKGETSDFKEKLKTFKFDFDTQDEGGKITFT